MQLKLTGVSSITEALQSVETLVKILFKSDLPLAFFLTTDNAPKELNIQVKDHLNL